MSVHNRIRLLFQEIGPNLISTKLVVIFLINALGPVLRNYTEMQFSISLRGLQFHNMTIIEISFHCKNYSFKLCYGF